MTEPEGGENCEGKTIFQEVGIKIRGVFLEKIVLMRNVFLK